MPPLLYPAWFDVGMNICSTPVYSYAHLATIACLYESKLIIPIDF